MTNSYLGTALSLKSYLLGIHTEITMDKLIQYLGFASF